MDARGRAVQDGIRFLAEVASDPACVLTLWKAGSGGKVVGCFAGNPLPEILYAARLLPISLESPGDISLLSGPVDAWMSGTGSSFPSPRQEGLPRFDFPRIAPADLEEALNTVEAVAEWASTVSDFPASEEGIWKSIRVYATRRLLLDSFEARCDRDPGFLAQGERSDILRAGIFLPPETHSRLLVSILGIEQEPVRIAGKKDPGDPLILLAKRIVAG
jgi:hypothetical protein